MSKRKHKSDIYRLRLEFLTQRINEINEWRHEAMKSCITPEQKHAIDARVFELRQAAESHYP